MLLRACWLMRILRHPARPGPRDGHDLGGLLPAPRAPHPGRQCRQRYLPAHQPCERLRLDVLGCTTGTGDADEEVPETAVELLDVSEHPHQRMVRMAERDASMQCRRAFVAVCGAPYELVTGRYFFHPDSAASNIARYLTSALCSGVVESLRFSVMARCQMSCGDS